MIIKINNFSDGIHHLELIKSSADLSLSEVYFGDVVLNIMMDKSHSQIVLNGDISVPAKFICDRCGEEFETKLTGNFQLIYLFEKNPHDSDDLNVYYITPEMDKIILNNDVRDFVILSEPMKKLCRIDCKGLCFKCGTNLNEKECSCEKEKVNDIWTPLLKLKSGN